MFRIQESSGRQWTLLCLRVNAQQDGSINSPFDKGLRIVTLDRKTGDLKWEDADAPPLEGKIRKTDEQRERAVTRELQEIGNWRS